jgi:dihydrolipoamide dehydrogenase
MYDLIVIGAGPGGYEAAAHAGRMGKKVALIEKETLGGTCLNVGCIPTKAFLKSARVFADAKNAAAFGVETGEVRLNMPAVLARKNRLVTTLTRGVAGQMKRAGVEVVPGCARLLSRNLVEVNGGTLEAKNILIATGSRPAVPPIPGIASEGVLDSSGALALANVPASVAIIGGGYIGLEFACFFSAVGSAVTVIEMLPQIAAGADQDLSNRLLQALRKAGVEFRTSSKVASISGGCVHYRDGEGAARTLEAECILNSTGRAPVLEDLGLEQAGVDCSPRGIRTSEEGKTNVASVWACGDVTGRRLLAHAATREGIVAVNNMFGRRDRIRYDAIPSVIYTHPEVSSVGRTEQELIAAGVPYRKGMVPMGVAGRFLVENEGGAGMVKVLAGAKYGEILGVHAMGDSSSEFIVAAAAMVETETCLDEAAEIVFPHPTVSEALREAILEAKRSAPASA